MIAISHPTGDRHWQLKEIVAAIQTHQRQDGRDLTRPSYIAMYLHSRRTRRDGDSGIPAELEAVQIRDRVGGLLYLKRGSQLTSDPDSSPSPLGTEIISIAT